MGSVSIREVTSAADKKAFIRLPWEIYAGDPNWVPPLLMDMKERMDQAKNPVFRHVTAAYFLAERNGRVVGRVSASVDKTFVEFQKIKAGHFGFFESIDDADVAKTLLDAACDWVRARGMESVIGPAAYNGNDGDYGCLIDGFGKPVFLHTYNPPYYAGLIDAAGFDRVRELWAYYMDAAGAVVPDQVMEFADHLEKNEGVVIRPIDKKNLKRDLAFWLEIYNEAWAENWGFSPLEKEEFFEHAKLLRYVIDLELALFCEVKGKPAGAALTVPNLNEAIALTNGRLLPLGVFKVLWALKTRKIEGCRVFTLGVKPEFRRLGVGAAFYARTLLAVQRLGYKWGDMSWILDNNDKMNRAIQTMGGTVWRRWQMFEKAV